MRMVSHRTTWVIAGVTVLACAMASGAAAQAPASPTFSRDVAPILFESCVACHRAGEVAPMSLTTYAQVRPWARSIKKKVASREMPPWHAAVAESLPMRNDRSLDQAEIDTIVAWVDAGAPKGNDADLPSLPSFVDGWTYEGGEPDYVVPMPIVYEISAEGEEDYLDFWSPMPWQEDRFAEVLELRPSNYAVTHHSAIYTRDLPEGKRVVDALLVDDESRKSKLGVTSTKGTVTGQTLDQCAFELIVRHVVRGCDVVTAPWTVENLIG